MEVGRRRTQGCVRHKARRARRAWPRPSHRPPLWGWPRAATCHQGHRLRRLQLRATHVCRACGRRRTHRLTALEQRVRPAAAGDARGCGGRMWPPLPPGHVQGTCFRSRTCTPARDLPHSPSEIDTRGRAACRAPSRVTAGLLNDLAQVSSGAAVRAAQLARPWTQRARARGAPCASSVLRAPFRACPAAMREVKRPLVAGRGDIQPLRARPPAAAHPRPSRRPTS